MCLKVVIEWWDVTSICIHDVSCSVYFYGINVTRMWHVTPHNERLVFRDKFALRHRNTIQECLTWWKEQETERTMNLLPIITLSENLLHKILAGLSCIVESACSKTWLLILGVFVHILHTLLHISAKHTEAGKAMKATYGNREWRTVFYISMLGWAAHEHYQIEITIHPQLFPFTLGPVFNQFYCHQPSHSFLFFPLTEKQRSWKGHCCQQCVALSSWLNHRLTNMVKRFYPQRVLARPLLPFLLTLQCLQIQTVHQFY